MAPAVLRVPVWAVFVLCERRGMADACRQDRSGRRHTLHVGTAWTPMLMPASKGWARWGTAGGRSTSRGHEIVFTRRRYELPKTRTLAALTRPRPAVCPPNAFRLLIGRVERATGEERRTASLPPADVQCAVGWVRGRQTRVAQSPRGHLRAQRCGRRYSSTTSRPCHDKSANKRHTAARSSSKAVGWERVPSR